VLTIATIFPELLGTYGDGGNALVLRERATRRHLDATVVTVPLGDPLPDANVYLLGGGEDGPQRQATDALRHDGSLGSRANDGAVVFAVCAGLQILGHRFAVEGGASHDGLGLLDIATSRGTTRRVGELLVRCGEELLVGFENHGGVTSLAATASLGQPVVGFGNDGATDGVREGTYLGTYAHGPALALNPWLADELLSLALRRELEPLATVADRLHAERLRVVQAAATRP
jgi:lipid II isoglutaminyl synthase (glutamine-hydrolysing)